MEATLRPRLVEQRAAAIVRRIADELIDGFIGDGSAELMAVYCEPLAALSLAEVIGLRGMDGPTLRRWFHDLATGTSNYEGNPAKQVVADRTGAEIDGTLRPLFEELLERPDGSMVSDMLHAEAGDVDERMRAFMPTLKLALIGGLQEPGHGLGSTIFGLLSNPDQSAALLADLDGHVKAAVDEGASAMLNGSAVDPDGDQFTLAWTQTSGPSVVLSNASDAAPIHSIRFTTCRSLKCPNSCASTASISSGASRDSSVSKNTIRFERPKPVKNALP